MTSHQPYTDSTSSDFSAIPGQPADVTGRYYIPAFPIGKGETDYEKYLKTVELLSLQKPLTEVVSAEEPLFQITHQASELWMKLMLLELDRALQYMAEDKLQMACRSFRLVNDCQLVLMMQVDLIGRHISVIEYGKIRLALGQGSGMESPGFNWLLEKAPHIWSAFSAVLARKQVSLREIYLDYETHIELHTLAECLMDYDDLFHKWRAHHMALVTRTIGAESNSLKGLSTQVLQKGIKTRFFPDLLDLRNTFTNESSVAYGGQPLETT